MTTSQPAANKIRSRMPWYIRWVFTFVFTIVGLGLAGACSLGIAIVFAWPNLPDVSNLKNYQPNLPLRIYTSDGYLMSEFGAERRKMTKINDMPAIMKDALLAIEDSKFYEHHGVDLYGVARAVVNRLRHNSKEGASTITMQVARNFYLSSDQKITRKFYEALLSYKIEQELSKDEILEVYMNQVFLGQNAYGFAAASQIYFGKPISQISLAEAAMLAGLPKAPSDYNPCPNIERINEAQVKDLRKRTKERQEYILKRLLELGKIKKVDYDNALAEEIVCVTRQETSNIHGDYASEMARNLVYSLYGSDAYVGGLKVYTTINSKDQEVAYESLRKGLMSYTARHGYQGPEEFKEEDPLAKGIASAEGLTKNEEKALRKYHPDSDELLAAVVLNASPKKLVVAREHDGDNIEITGNGLKLVANAIASKKIKHGSIVRIVKQAKGEWVVSQVPSAQAGFVAVDPKTGAIRALVGGFDFNLSKFNHVEQGKRQPGSSFKPMIYSAGLSKGLSPQTIVNDAPITDVPGWDPKNSDGSYSGPIPLRIALMKSKNLVSIRVLQKVTPEYAQEYAAKFGFDPKDHPAYLTMALGAGSVNMLQMAGAYSVFANGGYRVNPYLITKITDQRGEVYKQALPALAGVDSNRIIPESNAFLMDYMLRGVTSGGTAAKASAQLKRSDIAGKTGTTNKARDAWFAGYHHSVVGIAWVGFDDNRPLGVGETGGGAALPIWIGFMQHALKGVPIYTPPVPDTVTKTGGGYVANDLSEDPVSSLGGGEGVPTNLGDTQETGDDTEVEMTEPTRPDVKSQSDIPMDAIKPGKRSAPAPIDYRGDGPSPAREMPSKEAPSSSPSRETPKESNTHTDEAPVRSTSRRQAPAPIEFRD